MNPMTRAAALIASALLASGCIQAHRLIPLEIPAASGSNAGDRGDVSIGAIEDARKFENNPATPSTPSIKGDVDNLTPEKKQAMIGRQRTGFGGAAGDVALPAGQTVPERMQLLIKQALEKRGFKVVDTPSAPAIVTARVDEFWAWFTPHFATFQFEANVSAAITIKRKGKSYELHPKGYGSNQGQNVRAANWQLAYTRAFDDFLKSLDNELAKAGL